MPDEAKIKVTTPGAKAAERDLKAIADAEKKVGREASDAGRKGKKGADESREAMDHLGKTTGKTSGIFAQWKIVAVGAVAAVGAAAVKTLNRIKAIREEIKQNIRELSELTTRPDIRALADIRGASATRTAIWAQKTAREYDMTQQQAVQAAFGIESGLTPGEVGGKAAFGQIQSAAYRTASITGASGQTVAGLVLTAKESLGAKSPEQFTAFLAKARAFAKASMLSLEEFGQILKETLPLAVKAGIDPNYFMAQAAAISFRIGEPGMIRTSLRQMIAATARPSSELASLAKKDGKDISRMNATEIMQLQSSVLEQAALGGPQAIGKATAALGLSPEIAQVYMQTSDAASRARQQALLSAAESATFADIEQAHKQHLREPITRFRQAERRKKEEELLRGIGEAELRTAETEEEALFEEKVRSGSKYYAGLEAAGLKEEEVRVGVIGRARAALIGIINNQTYPPEVREKAEKLLASLTGKIDTALYIGTGVGQETDLIKAFRFVQENAPVNITINTKNGGTDYHQNDRTNPAGKVRPPRGQ